jgi:hypothetical protein
LPASSQTSSWRFDVCRNQRGNGWLFCIALGEQPFDQATDEEAIAVRESVKQFVQARTRRSHASLSSEGQHLAEARMTTKAQNQQLIFVEDVRKPHACLDAEPRRSSAESADMAWRDL